MSARSVPGNVSAFMDHRCRLLFAGLTGLRWIHGAVTGLLLSIIASQVRSDSAAHITIAALSCGTAIGLALDRMIATVATRKTATLVSSFLTTVALLFVGSGTTSVIGCAFLLGVGTPGDWSSTAEVARAATSTQNRWNAMRWFSLVLPVGLIIGSVGASFVDLQLPLLAGAAVVITTLVSLRYPEVTSAAASATTCSQDTETSQDKNASQHNAVASATGIVAAMTNSLKTEQNDAANGVSPSGARDDCDAVECCGGSPAELRPTPFPVGVMTSGVGASLFFAVLVAASRHTNDMSQTVALLAGLASGQLLLVSTAPRVGYIVLVPCYLLGLMITLATTMTATVSATVTCLLWGTFAGGAAAGMSAVTGELFSDCGRDRLRTRVLSTAMFVVPIVLLCAAGSDSIGSESSAIYWIFVCIVGMMAVRQIPSPVISNLGLESTDEQTEEERRDISAAIGR